MRDRGKIGGIGFDQQPVEGRQPGRFADRFRLGKRQHPTKAQMESDIQGLLRFGWTASEAMEDSAATVMLTQDLDRAGPGFPRVDHDRFTGVLSDLELSGEDRALYIARRKIVVIIET